MKKFKRKNNKGGSKFFAVRLPINLWKEIAKQAKDRGVSQGHVVIETLEEKFINPLVSKLD